MEIKKENLCNGPIIIVNYKNTKKGKDVLDFAKKINNSCLIAAVPTPNLKEVASKTDLITIAQHLNNQTPEELKATGAQGTLLNHSDNPIPLKKIETLTKQLNKLKLKVIVCTKTTKNVDQIRKFKPWAIAYEDPVFIGTKDPITNHPLKILNFTKHFKRCKRVPLCGAGIHKKEDVENAMKLGCKGILISSAVMNSKDPKALLKKLMG
jgi:triosephosphate isomerase